MSDESSRSGLDGLKEAARRLLPKQWWAFGLAIVGLIIALDNLAFPMRDQSNWNHYLQFGWYAYIAIFLYRAYASPKPS